MNIGELEALLQDMTIEEKIHQLLQVNSSFYQTQGVLTGPQDTDRFSVRQLELAGSLLGTVGAGNLRKFQDIYLGTQPNKIPMMFMADIINGYKTVFPIPLGQGATFNPGLSKECACATAKESAASGIHVTFSPMVDLVRDARWGRVMESTGEDVYLNSCFAKAMVEGYQGEQVSEKGRIAACVKHFAAYGVPMAGREYNFSELSERSLREDYLLSYQAAIEAGVKLVMTAFQTLDRIPCSGNKKLMRETLRNEMGFQGVLISDWRAIYEMISHGFAENEKEAAKLALEAGVDIDMMSDIYVNQLTELIESGEVEESLLDEAVRRILMLKNELGLFENPYKDGSEEDEEALFLCEAHRSLARKAAGESFVLLKNEGILPLKKNEKTAFLGPYINDKNIVGSWTIFADEDHCVSIKEGVLNKVSSEYAVFSEGCNLLDPGTRFAGFRGIVDSSLQPNYSVHEEEALSMAASCENVVLCLGEHRQRSGEGGSIAEITLPVAQIEFLKKVTAVNPNVAVVLFNGRPLDLREVNQYAKAILIVWFPGSEGGNAIADVLYGDQIPSGRLPMSFPFCTGQIPVFYSEFSTGRPFVNQTDTRFASKYLDIQNEPLYPFGYGLTYTEFSYGKPEVSEESLTADAPLQLKVKVHNTGSCDAVETVQLYIQDMFASVVRPVRELKAFKKVEIKAGNSVTVEFEITEEMLRYYGIDMVYKSEAGWFTAYVGGDSRTKNSVRFQLV